VPVLEAPDSVLVDDEGGCVVVVIGVDSHKRTHTVVAVDGVGRRLGEKTVRANRDGHLELLRWAARFTDVTWAVEDCRNLTRRFEADMLAAGGRVVRVPTRLMAEARRAGRRPGKSDPIDAEAVAIAALRHPDLPVAELDGPAREVRLSPSTGGTWSGNAPASPRRSAGTSTSSTRIWSCHLKACAASAW
jgi:hypothetical protein